MVRPLRQRRRMNIIVGLIGILTLIGIFGGKSILQLFTGPRLPGYLSKKPAGQYAALDWKVMQQGQWPYHQQPVIPPAIAGQEGKLVTVKGFMVPFHDPADSAQFYISELPRGCYFCNPPGANQVVEVNIAGGKELTPIDWPVHVYGKFKIAHGTRGDTDLYEIDDAELLAGY